MGKQIILQELSGVKVKHPRGADILANNSRDDSCFAVMYKEGDPVCLKCTVRVEHQGKEMGMAELCKVFAEKLKAGGGAAPVSRAPAEADKPEAEKPAKPEAEKPVATPAPKEKPAAKPAKAAKSAKPKPIAKPAAKAEGEIRPGTQKAKVLAALKKGELSMTEIVKRAGLKDTNYDLLNELIKGGLVVKKEGGGATYFHKKDDPKAKPGTQKAKVLAALKKAEADMVGLTKAAGLKDTNYDLVNDLIKRGLVGKRPGGGSVYALK